MRKIAISDIHGCALSFEALLDQLALSTADELYLLGDYIDRGPASKDVIDKIFRLQELGHTVHCLRGNHEDAYIMASWDNELYKVWFETWGGRQTMESFGVKSLFEVPYGYRDFIKKLGYVFEVDGYILVHAGLDFRRHDPLRPCEEMLYLRYWYHTIDHEWLDGRIIVHGHTPISREVIEKRFTALDHLQVLDIDGGCFAEHLPGKGWLCAFDLTNRQLFFQKNLDDVSGYWRGRK